MATKKQDQRKRKYRVHGSTGVGAPPVAVRAPAEAPTKGGRSARGRRVPPVPSYKRSIRKGLIFAVIMIPLLLLTSKNRSLITVVPPLIMLAFFVPLDYRVSKWVYNKTQTQNAKR